MALRFDLSGIKDWESVCLDDEGYRTDASEKLVMGMMLIGMSKITEKNWPEVWRRIYMIGELKVFIGERPTVADVVAHIGFTSNVKNETKATFHRRYVSILTRDADKILEEYYAQKAATKVQE